MAQARAEAVAGGYTPGHANNAVTFMAARRAASHAAFFLPQLKAGMRLLDCGCGPGTITLDLARQVAPGAVIGIDRSDAQFASARATAAQESLAVTFEAGDIDRLRFADASFDAAFAHALFEHLPDPAGAAAETRRVLTPGGCFGLRSPDWGGFLLYPFPPEVERAIAAYRGLMAENNGDVFAGRKLPSLLRRAGFVRVVASASYEIYQDPARIAEYLAAQLENRDATAAASLRAWHRDPEALFAQAWVEAIGWAA
jgi:ubiquinone/menaquinone biosynthesis C-methylase UbiE